MSDEAFINPVRQKIFYYIGIHKILINFLEDTNHNFEKILSEEKISIEAKVSLTQVYQGIFELLQRFCKNNPHNQYKLSKDIETFFLHFDIDLGQTDLLCQIYEGNIELCENIKEKYVRKFASAIETFGRKEKFLRFFLVRDKDAREFRRPSARIKQGFFFGDMPGETEYRALFKDVLFGKLRFSLK